MDRRVAEIRAWLDGLATEPAEQRAIVADLLAHSTGDGMSAEDAATCRAALDLLAADEAAGLEVPRRTRGRRARYTIGSAGQWGHESGKPSPALEAHIGISSRDLDRIAVHVVPRYVHGRRHYPRRAAA